MSEVTVRHFVYELLAIIAEEIAAESYGISYAQLSELLMDALGNAEEQAAKRRLLTTHSEKGSLT